MKVALITGGSRGLGKVLVEQLGNENWFVKELSRSGKGKNHIQGDLSNPEDVSQEISSFLDQLDLDSITELLLVHNAAVLNPIKQFESMTTEEIGNSTTINILAPVLIIKRFMEKFRDLNAKKTIVNISSGCALEGFSGMSLYCLGKAGMENYINTLSIEEERKKYPFSIVNFDPHIMNTMMQEDIRNSREEDFPNHSEFVKYKENGELLEPEFVAGKIIKLICGEIETKKDRFFVFEI